MSTNTDGIEYIYTRFITRNGKRIYHPKGGLYKFPKRSKRLVLRIYGVYLKTPFVQKSSITYK